MKINKIARVLLGALLTLTSCTLEEDPKGMLTPSTFYSTQDEVNMAVYALYSQVAACQMSTATYEGPFQGDDLTTNPGSNKQHFAEIDAFHVTDGNFGQEKLWSLSYKVIKAANDIILNAGKADISDEEKNIAIGQAKFWRAFYYFYLVRYFGDIPMPLDPISDSERQITTVENVYNQIVLDLQDCIKTLPTDYEGYGEPRFANGVNNYITKQASQGTLAAVYMAMAGWPLKKTELYEDAAELTKEIIEKSSETVGSVTGTGEYEFILEDTFDRVYAATNAYSKETVVGFSLSTKFGQWTHDWEFSSCQQFQSLGSYAGWGDGFGEIKFWKAFPEGPRKDATFAKKILVPGSMLGGADGVDDKPLDWYDDFFKDKEYQPMLCNMTYSVSDPSLTWSLGVEQDYDYMKPPYLNMTICMRNRCIRFSEILLWYAESAARSGNITQLAKDCLAAVRTRGNGNAGTIDTNTFADDCVKEHGWEVCGYWMALVTRRDDQMRMELLEDYFRERKANAPIEVVDNSGIFVKEKVLIPEGIEWKGEESIYMPYPALDASINPNM